MRVKGRYLVVAWMAVFLATVGVIVVRDDSAFTIRRRVDVVENRIKALQAMRANLETSIAQLESHEDLAPKAQALGLRFATDSELVSLTLPIGH